MTHLLSSLLLAANSGDPAKEQFFGLDPEKRFVLLIITIGCGTGVVIALAGIIASAATQIHRRRVEVDMKRELLDRGMTPDEVAKVIEAVPPPEDAIGRWINSWSCNKR